MKILLVNVCLRYDTPVAVVPVGLACIATALDQAGYDFDILDIDLHRYDDAAIRERLSRERYDVVGLGNLVSSYKVTKHITAMVREEQPQARIVVGNTVASIPRQLLSWNPQIDFAVIGEGERTMLELLEALRGLRSLASVDGLAFREDGAVVVNRPREAIPRMEDIPFPDYSLFEIEKYLAVSYYCIGEPHPKPREEMRTLPINTARGCVFDCTFCYHAFKGNKYRAYPFSMVLDFYGRLQDAYGINYLNFWDELTILNKARLVELCDAVEASGREVYWSISPRGNTFTRKDLPLLKRARSLGALTIGGALETSSPEILRAMNKKITPEAFIEQAQTAGEAGLTPQTSLVFGFPQETPETIRDTVETCRKAGVYPSAGFLLPLPLTQIYDQARASGRIEADEEAYLLRIGDRQDLHVNLTAMSDAELTDTVKSELRGLKQALGIDTGGEDTLRTTIYRAARKGAAAHDA